MKKIEWWDRFEAAINADGRAYRQISLAADLGENRVSQILKKGPIFPGPSAEVVKRICEAINVSLTYVYTGAQMTPEMEEILASLAKLDRETQNHFAGVLRGLLPADADSGEKEADFFETAGKN